MADMMHILASPRDRKDYARLAEAGRRRGIDPQRPKRFV